jgi:aminomethyltransferase
MDAGKEFEMEPCGLAARDVLRLEMGYPLHGQELTEDRTPFESGLGWAVDLDKGPFIGREALIRQLDAGLPARLRGLKMTDRLIPRPHYAVYAGEEWIGETSSGSFSPMLKRGIALAFLSPADDHDPGDVVEIDVRGKRGAAEIVRTPFVDRSPK